MSTHDQDIQTKSKADFWNRHITECDRSPLTQRQYCRTHSLALSTFGYWKRKIGVMKTETVRFYPLTVQSAKTEQTISSTAAISLHLCNNKYRIEVADDFSASSLQKLVRTLEQI